MSKVLPPPGGIPAGERRMGHGSERMEVHMRKKLVFALIVAPCIGLVACAGEPEGTTAPTAPSTTAPTPAEPFEITFDPDREDLPNRTTAEQIKEGMYISEVFSIMGLPQGEYGDERSLEWMLDNGESLIVLFNKEYKVHLVYVGWVFKTEPDREDLPDRAAAEQITEGMWIGDVYTVLGLPQREEGSGNIYTIWDLNTGGSLRILFEQNFDDEQWYVRKIVFD